jgi:hypothetical protein
VAKLTEAVRLAEDRPAWRDGDQARFFLGLSHLLAGNPQAARPHLRQAGGSTLAPVAEKARWYLAQASLLLEDPQEARQTLRDLAESGLVFRELAASQLEELQNLIEEQD